MKKNRHKKKSDYRHIISYKDLLAEKTHLAYRARYSEKQLEIRLLEISYYLHPVRLVPSLVTQWAQPFLNELRERVKDYLMGSWKRKRKARRKREE